MDNSKMPAPFLSFELKEDEMQNISYEDDGLLAYISKQVPFTREVGEHIYRIKQWLGYQEGKFYFWFEHVAKPDEIILSQ